MVSRLVNTSVRPIFLGFLSLYIAASVLAQIPGGVNETTDTNLGGNNFIVGSVFWPSGHRVNTRIGIRLTSLNKGDFITMTDDSGRFIFSEVAAGSYAVVIDGEKEYEPVAQQVEVSRSRNPIAQTYTLTIRLRDKAKSEAKPTVINAEIAAAPKRALDLYKKAVELAKTGDHKGAIEQLKLSTLEDPNFMVAFNEMGVQYLRLGELEKADEALQAALKIKPDAFEPLVNRGITLFRLKRYGDAEPVLRGALKLKEESAVGHFYLGRLLTETEHYDEAEKELNAALTWGGNDMTEAHRMLANLFIAKGDTRRAIAELETYLRLAPAAKDAEHLRQVILQLKGPSSSAPMPGTKPVR